VMISGGAFTNVGPVYTSTNDGAINTTSYKAPAPPS